MTASAAQARTVARDTYLGLFPLVTAYGLMYTEAIDPFSPAYAGGFGRWSHRRSVVSISGHRSTAHTVLHSVIWLDVRSRPGVLSIPAGEAHEQRIVLVTDLWGSTLLALEGVEPASVAVVGPSWPGAMPSDAEHIAPGSALFVRGEVSVEIDADLDRVAASRVRRGYRARSSGGNHRRPDDPAPPDPPWRPYHPGIESTLEFWPLANFALTQMAPTDECWALCERGAVIGVGPGRPWGEELFEPQILEAIGAGMDDALTDLLRSARSDAAGEAPPSSTASDPDFIDGALQALRSSALGDHRR